MQPTEAQILEYYRAHSGDYTKNGTLRPFDDVHEDVRQALATERRTRAMVIAHEMAHMWFGDLVTMRWWDDIWLNEGFASWMEGRTTAKLHPEWHTDLEDVASREGAMARDAVASTHPVVQHVETVEQASQAFDAITYSKGAAVIRMLERYVGSDAWRTGVRHYMRDHAYGNTVSDDFWREVQTAAGKPIIDIAHDFTLQPGVPLIRVDAATCAKGSTTLQLTQGEFTRDRPDKAPLSWRVPVIAQVPGHEPARTLVTGRKGTLVVPGCGAVVANAGQSGYYHSLYAPALFQTLREQFPHLATIDQLGVMADAWALGLAGLQPASDYLALVDATPAGLVLVDQAEVLVGRHGLRGRVQPVGQQGRIGPVHPQVGHRARPGVELDPGPELVALEQSILRHDPSLTSQTPVEASAACPYPGLLAYDLGDAEAYFGRESDVDA